MSLQNKEKPDIKENISCYKCNMISKFTLSFSCSHSICPNCIFKAFILSNFKSLTTFSINILCPACKKGVINLNLDDWIEILNQLLLQKNMEILLQ